jgi:hypothetical protein
MNWLVSWPKINVKSRWRRIGNKQDKTLAVLPPFRYLVYTDQ